MDNGGFGEFGENGKNNAGETSMLLATSSDSYIANCSLDIKRLTG